MDVTKDDRVLPSNLQPLRAGDPAALGQYTLLGRLGAGGMGVAYLGDGDSGWVVVKVLSVTSTLDKSTLGRLERELEAMSRAASDRTVHVLNHDLNNDPPWFAMEFVPGETLQAAIERGGPLPSAQLRKFGLDLALAISDVHAAGVIHRDLKPSNIILSSPHARIIDFGVAATEGATMLTKTGQIMGTMGWLAPEQISDDDFSEATDVHAWGLCVYFAATGGNPFEATTPGATMYRIVHEEPLPPASAPPRVGALISSALAKDTKARPTLPTIAAALDASDEGPEIHRGPAAATGPVHRRRSRGLLVASMIAIALGVVLGLVVGNSLP